MLLVLGRWGLPCGHLHLHSAWQKQLFLLRVDTIWSRLALATCGQILVCSGLRRDTLVLALVVVVVGVPSNRIRGWLVVCHATHSGALWFLVIVLIKLVDV